MNVLPIALALAAAAVPASAQSCFENDPLLPSNAFASIVAAADYDADGDLDVWEFDGGSYGFYFRENLGGGSWSSQYGINVNGVFLTYFDAFDFDGDGRAELGATYSNGQVKVRRFVGFTEVNATWADLPGRANHFAVADVDLDGDLDLAVASTDGSSGAGAGRIAFNTGGSQFVAGPAILDDVERVAFGDFDADGDADLALLSSMVLHVATNDGTGAFTLRPTNYPFLEALELSVADFDGDGRDDLAVGRTFGLLSILISVPGGFAPPVEIVAGMSARKVVAADFDMDSDVDLAIPAVPGSVSVFHNTGNGVFASPVAFECGSPSTLDAGDVDGDGDVDLVVSVSPHNLRVLRNCAVSGTPTCFGDGTATACPCGNASPVGSRAGCLHSLGSGGTLRASGAASIAADTVVLRGASMPNATALYFQGTSAVNGGLGNAFGDGLSCAGGSVTRLGTATNALGSSQYPGVGQLAVSVRGGVVAPGERHYQVWFRNAAAFCTPATFNLTNSLRLTWRP